MFFVGAIFTPPISFHLCCGAGVRLAQRHEEQEDCQPAGGMPRRTTPPTIADTSVPAPVGWADAAPGCPHRR